VHAVGTKDVLTDRERLRRKRRRTFPGEQGHAASSFSHLMIRRRSLTRFPAEDISVASFARGGARGASMGIFSFMRNQMRGSRRILNGVTAEQGDLARRAFSAASGEPAR